MAKVIGENIPPSLQTLWEKLRAQGKAIQGTNGSVRSAKSAKKPTKKPRRNLDLVAFQEIAVLVAKEAFTDHGLAIPSDFVFNLTRDMILGIFDGRYFRECKLDYSQTLESTPTYTTDSNPPPYGWRTINFMPSVPAYPNGVVVTTQPGYAGQKIGTLFADTVLRWRRLVFKSKNVDVTGGEKRVLMRWNVTIGIDTTSRGSRPMVSMNLRASLSTDTASVLTSKEPPIMERTVFYWRYKVPPSVAPYYHSYQVRREVKPLSRILKKSGTGLFTRYVLDASNRPMMGRGFNNNDQVQTSISGDPELWEITKCFPALYNFWSVVTTAHPRTARDIAYSSDLGRYVVCCAGAFMRTDNLTSWVSNFSQSNTTFFSIARCEALGIFVAVGTRYGNGGIESSTDGILWSLKDPGTTAIWTYVAASESLGIFVVFGYGGSTFNVCWSTDGLTFYPASIGPTSVIRGCVWVEKWKLFVAVGGGYSYTSPDGKTWSTHAGGPDGPIYNLAYSPILDCLVSTCDFHPNGYTAKSFDGITWVKNPLPFDNSYSGIAWCPPLNGFVMSGGVASAPNMLFSSDGETWTPMTTPLPLGYYNVRYFEDTCAILAVGPYAQIGNVIRLTK